MLWTGRCHVDAARLDAAPNLRPVRIRAGALGPGIPRADLVVSPQHRLLVRSVIAERLCGAPEVLVAAKHLIAPPAIDWARDLTEVSYIHLLCAGHQIVLANGAAAETLYLGHYTRRALPRAARHEVAALFPALGPEAAPPPPARPLLNGRLGRNLSARHARNARALQ